MDLNLHSHIHVSTNVYTLTQTYFIYMWFFFFGGGVEEGIEKNILPVLVPEKILSLISLQVSPQT